MDLKDSLRLKGAVAFAVVTVLTLSMLAAVITPIKPAEAQAVQLPRDQRNWEYLNGNEFGWNYNPQNRLNKDNVQFLELKWIYPMPTVTQQNLKIAGLAGIAEGSMAPPLVVDGTAFVSLNSRNIVALDAKTGKVLWTFVQEFNNTALDKRFPILTERTHQHGINYVDGFLWQNDYGCKLTAIDAKTGKVAKQLTNLCLDLPLDSPQGMGIPTNSGFYAGAAAHPPAYYKAGNILTWAMGGAAEGTQGGRSFVAGIDANTGKTAWRFFYIPPCGDPATCKPLFQREKQEWGNWLVQNCNKIWIQQIKACTLDQDLLRNDFGSMRFNSGVSNVWGTMVVDQETGILYFGTAQAGPDWNATHAPGFRLFGASIIAINAKNGELVWAHQTTARDLWDYDCSWNTMLSTAKVKGQNRKVVMKGCKNGIVYVLDAATGEALHLLESPDIKRTTLARLYDPRSKADMTKPWTNYPSTDAFWMNCQAAGCLESDIAYDPTRNMLFAASYNAPAWAKVGPADARGVSLASVPAGTPPFTPKNNATINAWDLDTGQLKWKYFIGDKGFRGGLMVSGGLIWGSAVDGFNRAWDADNGKVLYEANLGISTVTQPTIAADADGKIKVFRIVGGWNWFGIANTGSSVPGALMVFGLPDSIPQPKEVIKEVPKEIIKEVPKEVVKEVTVETVSPVSYAIVGIGIIIAVVGIVMSRRKKA
ncbi:MAG: PQQ-binding-like beta-propeller repeat protein [Thaumarchaeota archaeon]|nr:PQQ-binding-like beta-propeller repeat protein [Nitrososphaerota archaeon]